MKNNFRVVIPHNIDDLLRVSRLILDKNTNDGVTSKLTSMDMADFEAKYGIAKNEHDNGNAMNRDKEEAIQDRNLALGIDVSQFSYTPNTVLYYITSCRDLLLGLYKGNAHKLGKWGFVVNGSTGNVRVPIPYKASEMIHLGKLIIQKHNADGASSVLNTVDMTAFETLVNTAESNDVLAQTLTRDKESAFHTRNLALGYAKGQSTLTIGTILNYVTGARDVLLGHYKGNEQQLGAWGFEVNTSANPTDPEPEPELQTIVSGTVKDGSTQSVIGNATVMFNTSNGSVSVTTNPLGNYEALLSISGNESVSSVVTAVGYQPLVETVPVMFEQTTVKDFNLTVL